MRRASSIFLSSSPLTNSPSFSCEVTTIQCLPRPFTPSCCNDALEVEHLLHVAGDELADLVDHEDAGSDRAGAASSARRSARPACRARCRRAVLTPFTQESATG